MSHVFISHSSDDKGAADLILRALEKRGVKCWIAPRDVTAGGSYAESILNAIETANSFVLIYSNNSNLSPHVIREVERALNAGVNIIPVRFDQSTPSKSLDYLLATVHWLSISEPVAGEIAKAAEQIAAAVAKVPPKPGSPAQPTPIPIPVKSRSPLLAIAIDAGVLAVLLIGLLIIFGGSKKSQTRANAPQAAPLSSAPPQSSPLIRSLTVISPENEGAPIAPPVEEEAVDEMTQQNVTDFVKSFVHDLDSNDVAKCAAYFAVPCRYYANTTASSDDVRRDIQEEIADWKPRRHMLSPVKVTKVNGALRATFSVIYIYSGAKPHTSGISMMIVGLKPQARSYVIAAIAKTDVR